MLNNITLPNEKWKTLPNFDNYLISNLGRVWSIRNEIVMKPFIQNSGYYSLNLVDNDAKSVRFLLHRLVALVWVSNPNNKPLVNHIDGDKLNNKSSNLEWVTNSENINHVRQTGLNPYNEPTKGKKLQGAKKSISNYHGVSYDKTRQKWLGLLRLNGKNIKQKRFNTELEAARHYDSLVKELQLTDRPLNNV